jgi:hypothetical protein
LPALTDVDDSFALQEASNSTKPSKRKRNAKDHVTIEDDFNGADPDMSTSPEGTKTSRKKRPKKGAASPDVSRTIPTKNPKKGKIPQSPKKTRKGAVVREDTTPAVQPGKGESNVLREDVTSSVQPGKGKCLRCW